MAGPAGGRGGGHRSGGGGGGFGGGGHRGGGGGYHRRGGYYGGFYPYGRGGLIGGVLGMIMLPIIIMIFAVIFLIVNIYFSVSVIAQGGQVIYDEDKLQDYANSEYYAYFNDKTTEEDGIMVFIFTYEDNQELAYVAWYGDNLNGSIGDKFSTDAEFGDIVENKVNVDNYKFSLSKDLANVMDLMTQEIRELGLKTPFLKEHDMSKAPKPQLIDKTELNLNEETVNSSLERFTESTQIPVAMVVVEAEEVFGKTMPWGNIILSVVTLIIIGVCVYYIVSKVRRKKEMEKDLGGTPSFTLNEHPPFN